ncbi:MAG: hypothetical protein P1U40_06520 [Coxiellaceae bacterium]|nr:hypothetical protein [Coxiellaceae bacterium]
MAKYNFNFDDAKTVFLLSTSCYTLAKVLPGYSFISLPLSLMATFMLGDYFKDQTVKSNPHTAGRIAEMSLFKRRDMLDTERRNDLFRAVSTGGASAFNTITGELITRTPPAIRDIQSFTRRP